MSVIGRKKPAPKPELEERAFADAAAWARWLRKHHATSPGLWLRIAKKGSGHSSVTYPEALDVALAWGWIDGQKGKGDEAWWRQRFTRRGPRSPWSKVNREKVAALVAADAMEGPGIAEVERAKADGRWDAAYDGMKTAEVPADLREALDGDPRAAAFFAHLKSANRYAVLYRIQNAKRPETRARKIGEIVAMLARGETFH